MVDGRLINKAIGRMDVMPLSEAERIAIDLIDGKSFAKAKAPTQTLSDVLDDLLASPKGLEFKESYKTLLKRHRNGPLKKFMAKTPAEIDRHEVRAWYNKGSNTPTGTDKRCLLREPHWVRTQPAELVVRRQRRGDFRAAEAR